MLVCRKNENPSELTREFIRYVEDFMEEDRIHSPRFRVRETDYIMPEGVENL